MAKKKQMRQRVKEKLQRGGSNAPQEGSPGEGASLLGPGAEASTRVQRKVAKSVRFLEKLQSTQAALATRDKGVKKKVKRKGKKQEALNQLQAEALGSALGSLSEALGAALPSSESLLAKRNTLSGKARQKLVLHETKQISAVLAHPAFQSDPFSAIHEHLQRRLPTLEQPSTTPGSTVRLGQPSTTPAVDVSALTQKELGRRKPLQGKEQKQLKSKNRKSKEKLLGRPSEMECQKNDEY